MRKSPLSLCPSSQKFPLFHHIVESENTHCSERRKGNQEKIKEAQSIPIKKAISLEIMC